MEEAIRTAVCEDSVEEQERLLTLIRGCGIPTQIDVFSSGEAFLSAFTSGKYDLIFMDIYMSGMSGIDVITAVRRVDDTVSVAFATTSSDHTLESYRLDVIKYIEKPVRKKAVRELLELARLRRSSRPHLTLRCEGRELAVFFDRILYVEQMAHELQFCLTGGDMIHVNDRLDALEPLFAGMDFFRCHKSYLVNLAYVQELDRTLMVFRMKNGKNVHIRRESLAEARSAYERYLFDRVRGQDSE